MPFTGTRRTTCAGSCLTGSRDIGLDGFPLTDLVAGQLGIAADAAFSFTVGIDRTRGPFLMLGGDELTLTASAGIAGTACETAENGADPSTRIAPPAEFNSGRCLKAKLGFLGVQLRDSNTTRTGVSVRTTVNLQAATTDGKISLDDLASGRVTARFSAPAVTTNLRVWFRTTLGNKGGVPEVAGVITWNAGGLQVTDVRLNASDVVRRFLEPITREINRFTSPIMPVIDTLTAPVPVVSDLAELVGQDPVTLLGLLEAYAGADKVAYVRSLISIVKLAREIGNVAAGGPINVGAFTVNTAQAAKNSTAENAGRVIGSVNAPAPPAGKSLISDSMTYGSVRTFGKGEAFGVKGLSFPVFDEPRQIFNLLLGQDVDIVKYDLGTLEAGMSLTYEWGPMMVGPVPVMIRLRGSAEIGGRLGFGFDTAGLRKGPENFVDGLYIDDRDATGKDVPELHLGAGIGVEAGAGIKFAEAGLGGGLDFSVDFDINDEDGKLHLDEAANILRKKPICLFNVQGGLDAYINAYFKIWYVFGSKKWSWDLFRKRLFEFRKQMADCDSLASEPVPPPLAVPRQASGVPIQTVTLNGETHEFYTGTLVVTSSDGDDDVVVRPIEVTTTDVSGTPLPARDPRGNPLPARTYQRVTQLAGGEGPVIDEQVVQPFTGLQVESDGRVEEYYGWFDVEFDGRKGDDRFQFEPGRSTVIRQPAPNTEITQTVSELVFSGVSFVKGGPGRDHLTGGAGIDLVEGNGDDDTVNGGASPDTSLTDAITRLSQRRTPAADVVDGGNGSDQLDGGPGTDIVWDLSGTVDNDKLLGGTGTDLIEGSAGDDVLVGGMGSDGADSLSGGAGNDTLEGGDGNDRLQSALTSSRFAPCGAGTTSDGDDTLDGGRGDDVLQGRGGNDVVAGGPGADRVCGGNGDDSVYGERKGYERKDGDGTVFDDLVEGEAGDDALFGDEGADDLIGGDGGDTADGGAGNDVVYGATALTTHQETLGRTWASEPATVPANPAEVPAAASDAVVLASETGDCGPKAVSGQVTGANPVNCLSGGAGNDVIVGGRGRDQAAGGAGIDIVSGAQPADTHSADPDNLMGDAGDDRVFGGAGDDIIAGGAGNDRLDGGWNNDEIYGDQGTDALIGGDHHDILNGGASNDDLRGGRADGTDASGTSTVIGLDTVTYANRTSPVTVDIDDVADDAGEADNVRTDVEILIGTKAGGDQLSGSDDTAVREELYGLDGDDILAGRGGNDLLDGGLGNDTMYGDYQPGATVTGTPGTLDVISYRHRTVSVTFDFEFTNTDGASSLGERDVVIGADAEEVWGGYANDTILGTARNETLRGHEGTDRLLGGDGNDILDGGRNSNTAPDGDVMDGQGGLDTATYEPRTTSVSLNANGTGGETRNGAFENDSIPDTTEVVRGGSGSDVLVAAGGRRTIYGGPGSDTIRSVVSASQLYGEGGDDTMSSNPTGPDLVNGGAGTDRITYETRTAKVIARLASGTVSTTSNGEAGENDMLTQFEILLGGSGSDELYGGDGADQIYGSAGSDTIAGGAGDDLVSGMEGNDLINGDAGNDLIHGGVTLDVDILRGGDGSDTVQYTGRTTAVFVDLATGFGGQGGETDLLQTIENAVGGNAGDLFTGDANANTFDGGGGADVFDGGGGTDTVTYHLRGTPVAASLDGVANDGGYESDDEGDITWQELDHIRSGVERIVGGAGGNLLAGSPGPDALVGGSGADTLMGLGGADDLRGGAGNDHLIGDGADTWIDGEAGTGDQCTPAANPNVRNCEQLY